jgi:hypothetical protein
MAIACFRLFTLRPEPLLSVPFFLRCIADLTRLPAAFPYLAMSSISANAVLKRNPHQHIGVATRLAWHGVDAANQDELSDLPSRWTLATVPL